MGQMTGRPLCLVASIVAAMALPGCAHDRVLFTNANATGEVGILLDGQVGGSNSNDSGYTTAANGHVDPGVVDVGSHNEVVGYQQQRPVALLENAGWATANNDVTVPFPNEMGIGFKVWLLQGALADRQAQAIAACVKLDAIWRNERMGARITSFSMTDSTADSDRTPFLDFTCGEAASMRSDIGHDTGRVNVYYVNRVDFGTGLSTGNGVWCGSNTVVMGSNASDHLAAHEVGHAFALDHVNALTTNFNTTNVMHNASNNRDFLTEGQTFRAHLSPVSVINTTYNLRPGLPTRNCGSLSETATDDCPTIQRRIWADGAFPAN